MTRARRAQPSYRKHLELNVSRKGAQDEIRAQQTGIYEETFSSDPQSVTKRAVPAGDWCVQHRPRGWVEERQGEGRRCHSSSRGASWGIDAMLCAVPRCGHGNIRRVPASVVVPGMRVPGSKFGCYSWFRGGMGAWAECVTVQTGVPLVRSRRREPCGRRLFESKRL
ncbi:hypothetical protein LY76DRAFT_168790 [Colletotrichum caudatum]|nr:hypothetical protein LY76DRAFT_168790 [Colletotrichum caudatum]